MTTVHEEIELGHDVGLLSDLDDHDVNEHETYSNLNTESTGDNTNLTRLAVDNIAEEEYLSGDESNKLSINKGETELGKEATNIHLQEDLTEASADILGPEDDFLPEDQKPTDQFHLGEHDGLINEGDEHPEEEEQLDVGDENREGNSGFHDELPDSDLEDDQADVDHELDDTEEHDDKLIEHEIEDVYSQGDEFGNGGETNIEEYSDDDLQLIGSRQVTVVEIDSEDEIENLEEDDVLDNEEEHETNKSEERSNLMTTTDYSTATGSALERPVLIVTPLNEYLLVPEEGNPVFPGREALLQKQDLTSLSMVDFFELLSDSAASDDLPPQSANDYLRLNLGDLVSFTHNDHRTSDASFLQVLNTMQEFVKKRSNGKSFLKIIVDYDEDPMARIERLQKALYEDSPTVRSNNEEAEIDDSELPKKRRVEN